MAKICLDPGHGLHTNHGLDGYQEDDYALLVALLVRARLESAGHSVIMTRTTETDLDLTPPWSEGADLAERVRIANDAQADWFLSIHTNAVGSSSDPLKASGTETYHFTGSADGQRLAQAVQREVVSALHTVDRGVKTANFYVLRNTQMPSALVEVAFHTHPEDIKLLTDVEYQKDAAWAIAEAVLSVAGGTANIPKRTAILGDTAVPVAQAQAWAKAKGASQWFVDLAPLYWAEAAAMKEKYGKAPRPDMAYAQSGKETRYGNFGGVIPGPQYHNPCGLKTSEGGSNSDPKAHMQFPDDQTGVRAHMEHLALYAGLPGFPLTDPVDPRHFPGILGKAPFVEQLGGNWAPSAAYGHDIVRLLDGLVPFRAPDLDVDQLLAEITQVRAESARLLEENRKLSVKIEAAVKALT